MTDSARFTKFQNRVTALQASGMTRREAVLKAAKEMPRSHRAYVKVLNEKNGRAEAAATIVV